MKHIKRISQRPKSAGAFETYVCFFVNIAAAFLSLSGGGSPGLALIEEKCFIPEPNTGDDSTT